MTLKSRRTAEVPAISPDRICSMFQQAKTAGSNRSQPSRLRRQCRSQDILCHEPLCPRRERFRQCNLCILTRWDRRRFQCGHRKSFQNILSIEDRMEKGNRRSGKNETVLSATRRLYVDLGDPWSFVFRQLAIALRNGFDPNDRQLL